VVAVSSAMIADKWSRWMVAGALLVETM